MTNRSSCKSMFHLKSNKVYYVHALLPNIILTVYKFKALRHVSLQNNKSYYGCHFSHSNPLTLPVIQSDLASLYVKAGVKNIGTVFLMTDAQVADEKFLVLVNDLLASGNSRFC